MLVGMDPFPAGQRVSRSYSQAPGTGKRPVTLSRLTTPAVAAPMTDLDVPTAAARRARQLGVRPRAGSVDALLRAAVRVSDHGQAWSWRFLLIRGAARAQLGWRLVELHQAP